MSFFRRRKKNKEEDEIIEGEIEEIHDEDEDEYASIEVDSDADLDDAVNPYAPPPEYRARFGDSETPQRQQEDMPLERVAPDIPTPDEAVITPYVRRDSQPSPPQKARRRLRLPRIRLPRLLVWSEINPGLLLLALGLIAGGIFWTMHNRGQSSETLEAWWPLGILAFALLWAVSSLAGRRAASFLAASALAGLSISLLLDTQDLLTWHETLAGTVLIAVGIGIIARGLVLRQGTVAR